MPSPTRSAVLRLARTSVPPCFSVMPMPTVTAVFCKAGFCEESYFRDSIFGTHSFCTRDEVMMAATEALVIVNGQRCPASSCEVR